jgi:hypothetical protein
LWACGRKRFETRGWATAYRGPLAIHAAKKLIAAPGEELDEILIDQFGADWRMTLPRGAIIATTHLVACHKTEALESLTWLPQAKATEEKAQGDFSPGRYAWEIFGLVPLAPPIPWRGRQGLFDVPDDAVPGAGDAGPP